MKWKKLHGSALALAVCLALSGTALAMPSGGEVVSGTATLNGGAFADPASGATIASSGGYAVINWQNFGIASGESLSFDTTAGGILNRVTGDQLSEIMGHMTQKGTNPLFLVNPNGIIVGNGAVIDATNLTLSSLDISNTDFKKLTKDKKATLTDNSFGGLGDYGVDIQGGTINVDGSLGLLGSSVNIADGVVIAPTSGSDVTVGAAPELYLWRNSDGKSGELAIGFKGADETNAIRIGKVDFGDSHVKLAGGAIDLQNTSVKSTNSSLSAVAAYNYNTDMFNNDNVIQFSDSQPLSVRTYTNTDETSGKVVSTTNEGNYLNVNTGSLQAKGVTLVGGTVTLTNSTVTSTAGPVVAVAAQDGVLQNAAVEGSTVRDINGEVEIDDRNDMMNYKVSSSGDTITGNQVVMLTGKVDMDNDPTTITSPGNGALSIVTGEDMTVTTDTATGAVTPQTLTTSYFGNVRTKGATINGFDKMNVYTSNYLDQDSTITASSTSAAPEVNILAVDEVSAPGSYTAHYAGSANTNELQGNSMTLEGTTIKSQGTSGGSVNLKSGDLVLGENPGVNSRKSELVASALTAVSAKPITIESPNVSTEAFSTYKTDNATTSATSHALHSESNYDILTSKAQPNDTGAVLIGADSVIKTDNLTMSGYEISASSAKLTAKNISAAAGDALSGKAENGVTVYGAGTGATVTDVTKNAKLPKTDASGTKISATTLSSSDAATVKAPAVATPTTPTVLKDDFKAPVDAGSLTSKDIPAEVTAAEAAAAGKDVTQLNKENAATVMENVLDNYDGVTAQKEAAGDLARNASKSASSKDVEAAQIAGFIEGVDAMSDLSDTQKAEVKKSAADSFSTVQGANGDIANEGQDTEDRAAKKDEVKDTQSESDTTANHFVDDRTTIIVE